MTLLGHLAEDGLQALGEAHREHLVGLIEDDRMHLVQRSGAALHEVDEAPRGSDDDLYPTAERAYLRLDRGAAIDGEDTHGGEVLAVVGEVVGDLQAELTRRAEDEGTC